MFASLMSAGSLDNRSRYEKVAMKMYSLIYFTWPLRKQASCKQATRGLLNNFKSFPRD